MEPAAAVAWALAAGAAFAGVAARLGSGRRADARDPARDFYVLAWWALSAAAFLAASRGALAWAGSRDPSLEATLRVASVLAFVLAAAALLAAGAAFVTASGTVKSAPPARRVP